MIRSPRRVSIVIGGVAALIAACTPPVDKRVIDSVARDTMPKRVDDEDNGYICKVFRDQIHQTPQMGWFHDGKLLAAERHDRIQVLTTDSTLAEGIFIRVLDTAARKTISEKDWIACGDAGEITEYSLPPSANKRFDRAMYISQQFSGRVSVGVRQEPLDPAVLRATIAMIDSLPPHALHLDTALIVNGTGEYYSAHGAYDPVNHHLVASALFLHDRSGGIIAHTVDRYDDGDTHCCGEVGIDDGLGPILRLLNAFVFPGFAHPLLLTKTDSDEVSQVALETFAPDGQYHVLALSEFVLGCGHRYGQ